MSNEEWSAVKNQVEVIATEVVEWGRTEDVIYSLLQRELLTQGQVAHLRNLNTRKEQVRQLVALLAAAGDSGGGGGGSNLSVFLEVLQEQGMEDLVRSLDPSGAHSPDILSQDTGASSALRFTPYHHPPRESGRGVGDITTLPGQSYPTLPQQGQHYPTLPKPGQDITNNNNSFIDTSNANNTADANSAYSLRKPLKISVVPCREIGGKQFPKSEVYRNESEPRGYVFLANYKDFKDGHHDTRAGSEIDVKNLVQLFSQMGYKIDTHINMTKWDTIRALREFHNKDEHEKVDSCIVVFMSHGRDDFSFFTSDNQYLFVHEVVERFNNRECPKLMGKPKIFIFQFCRGSGPDVGVDAVPRNVSHIKALEVETDSDNFGETLVDRDPTNTDMYIVYSTVGGFVSFRHPESGSWLVEAICEVFMKDACNTELEHLMKKVSRRVRANFSTEGNKQACEFVQRAFDHHFFFNPKPLASLSSLNLAPLGETLPHIQPRVHLVHHHRRRRTNSPSAPAKSSRESGARSRHFSEENASSEKSTDNLDVLDHSHALHPRIKSLSISQRRMSAPESSNQIHGMSSSRSFNQLNSVGSSPEPSEAGELGASTERLSSEENLQQHWSSSGFPLAGACGGGSQELGPDAVMEEASPLDSPQEAFPLVHSQSALETIRASELGGVTGAGPEVRAAEEARMSFKRQLSVPSNNETLQKVNDVRRYLQLNESDETLIKPLQRIESFINKKKGEGKRRRKGEASSLEY